MGPRRGDHVWVSSRGILILCILTLRILNLLARMLGNLRLPPHLRPACR